MSTAGVSMPTSGTRPCRQPKPPTAPAAPPVSKCTRSRPEKCRQQLFVGETGTAQAGLEGLPAIFELRIARSLPARVVCAKPRYRVYFGVEPERFGNRSACLVDFALDREHDR